MMPELETSTKRADIQTRRYAFKISTPQLIHS